MQDVRLLEDKFKLPEDFSATAFFNEFYGVLTDTSIPLQHVRIRTRGYTTNYVRTLPFHHSQKEVETTEEYSVFTLDIRPTYDFVGAIAASSEELEVLEPSALRSEVIEWHKRVLDSYQRI